jgi:hypothetical protein
MGKTLAVKTREQIMIFDDTKADSDLVHDFGSFAKMMGVASTILIMPPPFLQIGRCLTKLALKAVEVVDIQDPFSSFRGIKMVQPP